MVTCETMVAVMVHCAGSMSASVTWIATLLQMASPALPRLVGSGAAAHKGRSRVRHFAGVFAFPVVKRAQIESLCLQELGCVSAEPLDVLSSGRARARAAHSCTARVRAPHVWMPTSSTSSATASIEKVRRNAWLCASPGGDLEFQPLDLGNPRP